MLCRAGRILSVIALAYLIGGHWAILQGIAWAGMLSHFSQEGDIGTALVKTFDGKHPCPLCTAIAKKRQTEDRQVAQGAGSKLSAVLLGTVWKTSPSAGRLGYFEVESRLMAWRTAPPIPPPRSVLLASV